jgi:hypothetical protein
MIEMIHVDLVGKAGLRNALVTARAVFHILEAFKVGKRLMRTETPTRTFALASKITGKTYRRGQYDQAMADVRQWIVTMEAALPIVRE